MHFLAVSLLSILAGTLLLAKFKKEPLGKFFAFISWFFIVVGFVLFVGFMTGGILKMTHHFSGDRPGCRNEMMMKECGPGMHHGACCPGRMPMGMCCKKPGGMPNDSLMKCCHAKVACDSTKMPVQKK
jgi:hypothetical protein